MPLFSPARLVRWCSLLIVGSALVGLAGCARPVGSVSGKVTIMSKPLKGGYVTFISNDGQQSVPAEITEEGTYSIPTITAGSYQITVETESLAPRRSGGPFGGMQPPSGGAPKTAKLPEGVTPPPGYHPSNPADAAIAAANAKNAKRYVQIPSRYAESGKSGLTYVVVGGPQTHDLDLTN